ncbi:MAG: hypothetical protein R3F48_04750 [Candidatus Zixiibacteriota bacterium]
MDRQRIAGKRLLVLFLVFLLLAAVQGCKSKEMESRWTDKPMKIDGKINDWSGIPILTAEDSDVGLGLCNDSQNIYIVMKFRNPVWLQSIRRAGINIWIDKKAKKEKDFGFVYNGIPTSIDLSKLRPDRRNSGDQNNFPQMGGDNNRMGDRPGGMRDEKAVELRLIDVNSIFQEAIIATDGSEGPEIACDTSMSFIVYEMKVPLPESMSRFYGIGTAMGEKLSLGFIWNNMEEMRKEMSGSRPGGGDFGGGGPGGGMGGPPGGGMGGGPGGGGPPGGGRPDQDDDSMKKQEIWVKTILADPAATLE